MQEHKIRDNKERLDDHDKAFEELLRVLTPETISDEDAQKLRHIVSGQLDND